MMKKNILFVALCLILVSCNKNKDYVVTIHTSFGDIKAILYEETPKHKANFIALAESGRYDSTIFHRVINEFMIQGGNIDDKEGTKPTRTVDKEFVSKFYHVKGALAAARQGDNVNPEKGSSWCQFYIVHGKKFSEMELTIDQPKLNSAISRLLQYESNVELKEKFIELNQKRDIEGMNQLVLDNVEAAEKELGQSLRKSISPERLEAYTTIGGAPHLDDQYTVFGRVVEGLDVLDAIATQRVAGRNKPIKEIPLTIELEAVKKKEITKKYGYIYPED